MTSNNRWRQSFKWLALEGTAIIISILLAFWIDAWWGQRQERVNEQLILASVLEDFRTQRELVEGNRPYIEAIRDSTEKLLSATVEADHGLSSASIDVLLADIWWNNNAAIWTAPALNSLVSSGDISRISNVQLRNQFVEWSNRFNIIRETVAREVDFYDSRLMVFMEHHVSMPQILNTIDHVVGNPEINYDYRTKFSIKARVDHSSLLSNQQFQGLLTRRSILLNDILTQAFRGPQQDLGLEDDLGMVISAIEAELSEY